MQCVSELIDKTHLRTIRAHTRIYSNIQISHAPFYVDLYNDALLLHNKTVYNIFQNWNLCSLNISSDSAV